MASYGSDSSDDQPADPIRLFGRQKPLHSIFGGGKVADILLWRNKKISGAILAGFTLIWYLFEVAEYHFVTLFCHLIILLMFSLFIWSNSAGFINRDPPTIHEIQLSESTWRSFFAKLNWFLIKLHQISCGGNLKEFVVAITSLWILSVLGSLFSSLNLLYMVFLCIETLPALYERYEREVDIFAGKSTRDMRKLYNKFDSKVLNKIPRGPVKEKKFT